MPELNTEISRILADCEKTGVGLPYDDAKTVQAKSLGKDLYIVSDLHLAAGTGNNGTYGGTENFFADKSFQRFIRFASAGNSSNKTILIINGDFIDFLRVVEIPD